MPELIGGVRNWDYRYCWLRDATFALRRARRQWLHRRGARLAAAGCCAPSRATRTTFRSCTGRPASGGSPEFEVPWLSGYEGSQPGPDRQRGLHAVPARRLRRGAGHPARRPAEGRLERDEDSWALQRALLANLERRWREPDEGIWEVRGGRRHFTHSKVMAWVAFDRGITAIEEFGLEGPLERWRAVRDEIHAEVLERGFDEELGSFVQSYDVEAARRLAADDPARRLPARPTTRACTGRSTRSAPSSITTASSSATATTRATWSTGCPPGEGSFFLCSFWFVDNLALIGRVDEAVEIFERLLALRNELGLLSEEYDRALGRLVGNFPQAFSHIGLINTAMGLERALAASLMPVK